MQCEFSHRTIGHRSCGSIVGNGLVGARFFDLNGTALEGYVAVYPGSQERDRVHPDWVAELRFYFLALVSEEARPDRGLLRGATIEERGPFAGREKRARDAIAVQFEQDF